jgi:hypothetical protein
MMRSNAMRVVAGMTDLQAGRYWTVRQFIGKPMSKNGAFTATAQAKDCVLTLLAAGVVPTIIRFVNVPPEPLFTRHRRA